MRVPSVQVNGTLPPSPPIIRRPWRLIRCASFWASGGMADALASGASVLRDVTSSPLCPHRAVLRTASARPRTRKKVGPLCLWGSAAWWSFSRRVGPTSCPAGEVTSYRGCRSGLGNHRDQESLLRELRHPRRRAHRRCSIGVLKAADPSARKLTARTGRRRSPATPTRHPSRPSADEGAGFRRRCPGNACSSREPT